MRESLEVSDATLTVAIPFHRGIDYLRTAIESVLAQREGGWRLLVMDDCGEADAAVVGELVAEYADDRIRYERNSRNLGMVENWNRCLDRAEGDLVTLLHADDRLLPDYTSLVRTMAAEHPQAVALFCGARIIGADGRRRFSLADFVKRFYRPSGPDPIVLAGEEGLQRVMAGNFVMCPTLCFRRAVLGDRRFQSRWHQVQDLELTSRLLLEGERLVGTRRVEYAYRRHTESATTRQSESLLRFDEEFELFADVADRAESRGWRTASRTARRARIVRLHLLQRATVDLLRGRAGPAFAKIRWALDGRVDSQRTGGRP